MLSTMKNSEVVISGVAGRFPKTNNLAELKDNLYGKMDLLSDCEGRWTSCDLPPRCGLLKDMDKFDSIFFGIHSELVQIMDPQLRFLLELSIEALLDAGLNPSDVRNTQTNVYVAPGFPESTHYNLFMNNNIQTENLAG